MPSEREQSIAFLRSLKAGDEGKTVYQDVIDDVLAELDEARLQRAAAAAEARAEALEECAELAMRPTRWGVPGRTEVHAPTCGHISDAIRALSADSTRGRR